MAWAPHLEALVGPHTALHTAVLWREDTRTCPNQSQCGSLSNRDTSCSLKATHASKMKFHEHMLEPPRGNPNEIPVLSLLPSTQCCRVKLTTNVHRARGMEKVINRVMLLIFTSANSNFHIHPISQDGCYGVNAKQKNTCLWERGAGGFHYSPSLPLQSRPGWPLEMRERALHQSIKEASCLAKLWESIPRIAGNERLWHVLKLVEEAVLRDHPRQGWGSRQRSPLSSRSQWVRIWAGRTSLTGPPNCIPDWVTWRWQEVRAFYVVNS